MKVFEAYQTAVNEIDDYFEYSHESEKDKRFVMGAIDRLTNRLIAATQAERNEIEAEAEKLRAKI